VTIVSLATACVMDLAMGPYKGKETGESALLRSMLTSLAAGDIAVADRYYCSFMMIALLLAQPRALSSMGRATCPASTHPCAATGQAEAKSNHGLHRAERIRRCS
jgi:hypothetical protein